MKRSLFSDGQAAQVAFWDVANADYLADAAVSAAAYTADKFVFVAPVSEDTWIAVGSAPTAVAATDGNSFIPYGQIAVLAVSAGDKISCTKAVCVTPVK
jgi:hypothetical protein